MKNPGSIWHVIPLQELLGVVVWRFLQILFRLNIKAQISKTNILICDFVTARESKRFHTVLNLFVLN